ncbi:hypothetical protein [Micromonospora sp. WMMD882]|uniref:hypothetical protein n=1 Tax=Micromonospora sp. WMMD882 TaxID=3015151 RepID=UPI00248C7DB8|nr:hypothetical protein [Micromonospora sp. WMMD882]
MAGDVSIKLTQDQALVLSAWLDKVIGTARFDALADEDVAVWAALHRISGALETSLAEIFTPEYAAHLDAARERLRADLGADFVQDRQPQRHARHREDGDQANRHGSEP